VFAPTALRSTATIRIHALLIHVFRLCAASTSLFPTVTTAAAAVNVLTVSATAIQTAPAAATA